jgi:hypothetical protein
MKQVAERYCASLNWQILTCAGLTALGWQIPACARLTALSQQIPAFARLTALSQQIPACAGMTGISGSNQTARHPMILILKVCRAVYFFRTTASFPHMRESAGHYLNIK